MTNLSHIQSRLQNIGAAIARIEQNVATGEAPPSVVAMRWTLEKQQRTLERRFLEEADSRGIDVCSYRLLSETKSATVLGLSYAMADFQRMLSVVYDAIKNGPQRDRGRISAESAEQSTLNFGYSFAGSVGLVFTVPNERLLLGESGLDQSIRLIFEMVYARDSAEMASFAQTLGSPAIRSLDRWAEHLVAHNLGVGIEWRRGQEIRKSIQAQTQELQRLRSVIDETSGETTEHLSIIGKLVDANFARKRFQLEVPEAEDVHGTFTDAIGPEHEASVPHLYKAILIKTTKVLYSMDRDEVSYFLERLEPPG